MNESLIRICHSSDSRIEAMSLRVIGVAVSAVELGLMTSGDIYDVVDDGDTIRVISAISAAAVSGCICLTISIVLLIVNHVPILSTIMGDNSELNESSQSYQKSIEKYPHSFESQLVVSQRARNLRHVRHNLVQFKQV